MDISGTFRSDFLALALIASVSLAPCVADADKPRAKNVILLIGDGLGAAQRDAARMSYGTLAMDGMPISGWLQTHSATNRITDSAAAATALATGVKTGNGMIGVDPESRSISTILEQAQHAGKAVGLVTDTQIAHATPAAFAAHVMNRSAMQDIAVQMLSHQPNVLLGGGENEFLPTTERGCFPEAGERKDGRNLIQEAIADGYTYICNPASLKTLRLPTEGKLIGLFADEGMPTPINPTLKDMTMLAIDVLSQDLDGFFLMVEGGQIDWAGHDNDASNLISRVIAFDEAVAVALDFTDSSPETLVIVVGDHETGGMSLTDMPTGLPTEDGPFKSQNGPPFYINWTSDNHTAAKVPVSAQGPGAEQLRGIQDNTAVYDTMRDAVQSIAVNRDSRALHGD